MYNSDIYCLDVDNIESVPKFEKMKKFFKKTKITKSRNKGNPHFYFKCPDMKAFYKNVQTIRMGRGITYDLLNCFIAEKKMIKGKIPTIKYKKVKRWLHRTDQTQRLFPWQFLEMRFGKCLICTSMDNLYQNLKATKTNLCLNCWQR